MFPFNHQVHIQTDRAYPMGKIDAIIVAAIVISVIYSLFRGFLKDLMSAVSVIAAIIIAAYIQKIPQGWAEELFGEPGLGIRLLSLGVPFIIIFIVLKTVTTLLRGILGVLSKPIDKVLGGVVGLAKVIMLVAVTLFLINAYADDPDQIIGDSVIAPWIIDRSGFLADLFPDDLTDELEKLDEAMKDLKDYKEEISDTSHITEIRKKMGEAQLTKADRESKMKEIEEKRKEVLSGAK